MSRGDGSLRLLVLLFATLIAFGPAPPAGAGPEGQMTWAVHTTLYPDINGLFREQAAELDRTKREVILHRIQQLVHERAMFVPIWDFAFLHGVGPRVRAFGKPIRCRSRELLRDGQGRARARRDVGSPRAFERQRVEGRGAA